MAGLFTTAAIATLVVAAQVARADDAPTTVPLKNPNERPEWTALYRERLETWLKSQGPIPTYSPMEDVAGVRDEPVPMASAGDLSIDPSALAKASAYAQASQARAFIVWHKGKIQRADYFMGGDRATPIVSKSLSKPLAAIAIGRAIALGTIRSLDQSAADYIPEWRGSLKAGITLRHLLQMRSGLLEQSFTPDPEHPTTRAYLDPDHGWHMIHNYPLTDAPGSRYGYSNAAADLIALIIERATGVRYAEFVGREILKPIGATGGRIWIDRPGGLAHSGCCMTMPAETWLRLAVLLAEGGKAGGKQLLDPSFVAQMPQATVQNSHYGLGVWVAGPYVERRGFGGPGLPGPKVLHSRPYPDKDLFLFDGNSNQVIYISSATQTVILRVGDTPPEGFDWDNSLLPALLLPAIRDEKTRRKLVPQS
jgi:CubicO group peptidase (beta-lactamase class C family)